MSWARIFSRTSARVRHIAGKGTMDLTLPALGEGADSGTVVNLFVKEGDQIAKDQPVLELENEKAVATIPASSAGTVSKLYVKTGDKISVGQRILSIQEGGEKPGAERKAETKTPPSTKAAAPKPVEPAEEKPDEGEVEEPPAK